MTYRDSPKENYSLEQLTPDALNTCAMLAWELLCRDRVSSSAVSELMVAAGAGEALEQRLAGVIQAYDAAIAAEGDRAQWEKKVSVRIDKLTDPPTREVVFSFLFDLATIATINPVEAAFLDRLRTAWNIVDR